MGFPPLPVFAHGHLDGVGCWVTCSGAIDCESVLLSTSTLKVPTDKSPSYSLQTLLEPFFLDRSKQQSDWYRSDRGRETIRTHKAALNTLLSLRVLVQNRRKQNIPILVYGSQAQVVSLPSGTQKVRQGSAPRGDNRADFTRDR